MNPLEKPLSRPEFDASLARAMQRHADTRSPYWPVTNADVVEATIYCGHRVDGRDCSLPDSHDGDHLPDGADGGA
jgi:hypothetical protein